MPGIYDTLDRLSSQRQLTALDYSLSGVLALDGHATPVQCAVKLEMDISTIEKALRRLETLNVVTVAWTDNADGQVERVYILR